MIIVHRRPGKFPAADRPYRPEHPTLAARAIGTVEWRSALECSGHPTIRRAPVAIGAGGRHGRRRIPGHVRWPARGVRCAQAIVEAVRPLGIEIRSGLHTGEVALDGDQVRGIAVHIGARVGTLAGSSEVLVSQTVKDLVAGSGLTFEDASAS